ncbi:adhesion G-protein coupled receptor G5-like [Engraulis encrasicolus]|uniref:adhesion G-protein coupled receptor G5-like n=1 Tax=Engraulis encrasicolus TaxID=184585 RepID=UPI002FD2A047
MCGIWRHGGGERWLTSHLSQGCGDLDISANATTLYIKGAIAATQRESMKPINVTGTPGTTDSPFCVYWEPLVDRLQVEVDGKNHTVLQAAGLQGNCCTDLSEGRSQSSTHMYGIVNGSMRTDIISTQTRVAYNFYGATINCKLEFCEKAIEEARRVNMIEEAMMSSDMLGSVNTACFHGAVLEMDDNFKGHDLALPSSRSAPLPSVHFPAALKPVGKPKARVVCTFFQNNTIFNQKGTYKSQGNLVEQKNFRILDDVVGITVENEIVRQLPEPIKIRFHHAVLPKNHSRTCVSWDTRKDPNEVTWEREGCKTELLYEDTTECHCNHLTYFSILVQVEQRESQCHLEALTYITALGCAISALSCMVLFYSLCKKSKKKSKDQAAPIHRGLVITLFCLSVLFFLTGTLANAGGESVCRVVGALLHYALLSSFCWMGVEILHTFWMVYMIFSSPPKPPVWYILGFGVPAIPVGILVARDDIYGVRMIAPSDDIENPYMMCWMKDHPNAWLAHYMTNVAFLVLVVTTGLVMLCVVLVKIQNRDEWMKRKTAFLSMWGLSCLFGTTWILGLFEFGSLSCAMTFVFCLINTLQGFFIMLRYYALDRMRKRRESILDGSSSSSTRQHMLQQKD